MKLIMADMISLRWKRKVAVERGCEGRTRDPSCWPLYCRWCIWYNNKGNHRMSRPYSKSDETSCKNSPQGTKSELSLSEFPSSILRVKERVPLQTRCGLARKSQRSPTIFSVLQRRWTFSPSLNLAHWGAPHTFAKTAKMKYVLVSGGMYIKRFFLEPNRARSDRVLGVISGIGKGVIGMCTTGR